MKILNEQSKKNPDVSIGIIDEKDDVRKFKFKRPLMLKIFIPLCIITLSTIVICLFALNNKYEIISEENNSIQYKINKNLLSPNNIRDKRQLEPCEKCDELTDEKKEFEISINRCKKNIEDKKDCCELHKKIREFKLSLESIRNSFGLLDIPCQNINKHENRDLSSSSSNSNSSQEEKYNKTKILDENNAKEIDDNNSLSANTDWKINFNVTIDNEDEQTTTHITNEFNNVNEAYNSNQNLVDHESDNNLHFISTKISSTTVENIANYDVPPLLENNDNIKNEFDSSKMEQQNIEPKNENIYSIENYHSENIHRNENFNEYNKKYTKTLMEDNFLYNPTNTTTANEESFNEEERNNTELEENEDNNNMNYDINEDVIQNNDNEVLEATTTDKNNNFDDNNNNKKVNNYYTGSYEEDYPIDSMKSTTISIDEKYLDGNLDVPTTVKNDIYENENTNTFDSDQIKTDSTENNDSDQSLHIKLKILESSVEITSSYPLPQSEILTDSAASNNYEDSNKEDTSVELSSTTIINAEDYEESSTKDTQYLEQNLETELSTSNIDIITQPSNLYTSEEQTENTYIEIELTSTNYQDNEYQNIETTSQTESIYTTIDLEESNRISTTEYNENSYISSTPTLEDNLSNDDEKNLHIAVTINIEESDENTEDRSSTKIPIKFPTKQVIKPNYYKEENQFKKLIRPETKDVEHTYYMGKNNEQNEDSIEYYIDSQGNPEDFVQQDNDFEIKLSTSTNNYKTSTDIIDTTTTEEFKNIDVIISSSTINNEENIEEYTELNGEYLNETENKMEKDINECSANSKCISINQSDEINENVEEKTSTNTYEAKEWIDNESEDSMINEKFNDADGPENSQFNTEKLYTEQIENKVKNFETTTETTNNLESKIEEVLSNNLETNSEPVLQMQNSLETTTMNEIKENQDENEEVLLNLDNSTIKPELNTNFYPELPHVNSTTQKIHETETNIHGKSQLRIQDGNGNDIRIVNQNPIAQRFQNTGTGGASSKFDNIFQLPPIETSKASQQLTVNTNMLPMCFYGMPNQNVQALRQPGYDSQLNPFSMSNTAFGAFGYPQMYGQQPMYSYYNSMMGQQKYSQSGFLNQPPHMNNPYFCTYVPSSSLQFPPVTGLQEFRYLDKNFRLPEDIDDKTVPKDWYPTLINSNKSRSSANCLLDEKSCFDGSQCITNLQWCDGFVHCADKSDELGCPCKTRVDKSRLCDGYFDCPNGEDELGCFGCSETEFSCDDWSERQKKATCVPLQERCDGIPQCKTGKDEMDCSLLTNTINVHQTYAVSKSSGFLHRNFKGNWYPVCSNTDTWVLDACLAEVGPQATFPLVHMLPVPTEYNGKFLTALPEKKIEFLQSCIGGEAIYIICPPIPCGTRLLPPPNHYRKQEVDTSAEDDFLPFVNRLRRFTDELYKVNNHPNILSSNDFNDKKPYTTLDMHVNQHLDIHRNSDWSWEDIERHKRGETRVVGGKPSQPTSWPWVVAIYRNGVFHCGGVLMSELWIITAAHCVDTYWQHYYEVQAGMLRRFSFSPMEQNRVVSNIVGHQMYDRTDMKNDLALLKVATPFQFNRWVRPVCLPSESSAGPNWMWGPQPGTICTAVGWGATIEHGPDPDHMREVEVPILPRCKHREDQEGQEICAGYLEGGRDACQGDSGGPLLCRNPIASSQWYVAGIVSHGEGCARPNEPGAYTRVSLYLNWIARSILDENLPKRKPIQKCPGTLCLGTRRCISKKRRCDKTVDCLVGDDEVNCPKSDFPSLIKHAFDNMLLFAPNNMTTSQPNDEDSVLRAHVDETETNEPQMETNDAERKEVKINSAKIVTIAEEHSTENDSITWSAFKDDGGQTTTMNRNGHISSTFTAPLGEISDITSPITNARADSLAPTAGETPKASIMSGTFVTVDDTISESTTTVELTTESDMTVTAPIHSTEETPPAAIINDPRGALNTNDKNIVDMDHKTKTTTTEEIKSITETSTAYNDPLDDFPEIINNTNITNTKMPTFFECRKMLQLIPAARRCNNVIDCEDGTDEARCSCKGYLFSSHPNAICDGVIDCADGSDEKNCINCPGTHFHCHLSQQCIPKSLQCNHEPDCFFSEDEWDCFALTNGSYIRYDSDERPELRGKGVMSFSISGKWFPLCNNNWFQTAHDVAGDMCAYLGFSGYKKYFEIEIEQDSLEILSKDSTSLLPRSSTNETCRGLYVRCSNSLSDTGDMKKIYTAHQSGVNTFKEVLMSPWNAAIFVDGVYTCSGTLIEKNWVITSRICFKNIHLHINYTTVMLGSGRGHFNVIGPHEQISVVSELIKIIFTDVILLKLQTPVTLTRYVRPLYIRNINSDIISERETCIVMGKENDSFMQVIVLKPVIKKCFKGKRCFKRVTPSGNCDVTTSAWGGSIVCLSETGWYPAAVYYDQRGLCGFRNTTEFCIRNLKARIITEMNKRDFPVTPPSCNGIRCPLGQCINVHRMCNGISDCRDGSDETQDTCDLKLRQCTASNNCECSPNEIKCHNGRCVPKNAFCNRINDCGDWSDEPARCTCAAYLSLVAPDRICNSISNCHDKSDENPRICECTEEKFKCAKSGLCIPNEWVCDGENDCSDKEDELFCVALKASKGVRDGVGEVVLRSYGVWHSYCIREKLSTPDLLEICEELGYNTAHAAAINKTFTRPAQDITRENYSLVRFNEYVMMFLKGNYPTAKLQNNDKCERLYIECTP